MTKNKHSLREALQIEADTGRDVWIMCASSESADNYHSCAAWDHEPTKDEINSVLVELDAIELSDGEEFDDVGYGTYVEVDGKRYDCYAFVDAIRKVKV